MGDTKYLTVYKFNSGAVDNSWQLVQLLDYKEIVISVVKKT